MENSGDKIILQIVPSIIKDVLDVFEGDSIMKWKNLSLKRLENQDVCIWQQEDNNSKNRIIDPSLFLPAVNAVIIFYEIHDKKTVVEWLQIIINDIRLQNVTPIIVGCYQKGENTMEFEQMFSGEKERVFLWRIDDEVKIVEIYQSILSLIV